jgi:hypothetical protein
LNVELRVKRRRAAPSALFCSSSSRSHIITLLWRLAIANFDTADASKIWNLGQKYVQVRGATRVNAREIQLNQLAPGTLTDSSSLRKIKIL